MNRNIWELYKTSERGRRAIEVFNPNVDDLCAKAEEIFSFVTHIDEANAQYAGDMLYVIDANCQLDNMFPEDVNPTDFSNFERFIDNLMIVDVDQYGQRLPSAKAIWVKQGDYRAKSALIHLLSTYLYLSSEFYKPILYPSRFDVIMRNCDLLGIEIPEIPHSRQYRDFLIFYYRFCEQLHRFQSENQMTDAEFCACLYDFAPMLSENQEKGAMPNPINVWFTGASGGDFKVLDNPTTLMTRIWACNEHTRRGDLVVVYCLSPRSYIHSIWRADSNGVFNPFDYYKSRTTLSDGVVIPPITIQDLRNDIYFSQLPIVRKNLQGLNGVQLSSTDYAELLRLIQQKGGDITKLPQLYSSTVTVSSQLRIERDVEELLLIPTLMELGYSESDWSRQCTQKAGRGLKAIPDFVFFPHGEKHLQNAPMLIEAKYNMSSQGEFTKAFNQVYSYARLMRSSIMGICDKDRLIIYRADSNGVFDRSCPAFENHWAALKDAEVFNQLQQIIARPLIANL